MLQLRNMRSEKKEAKVPHGLLAALLDRRRLDVTGWFYVPLSVFHGLWPL